MIVGRTMWTQSTSVTDGRTDRITITDTVQTASHGKNDGDDDVRRLRCRRELRSAQTTTVSGETTACWTSTCIHWLRTLATQRDSVAITTITRQTILQYRAPTSWTVFPNRSSLQRVTCKLSVGFRTLFLFV